MDVGRIVERLRRDPELTPQIAHWHVEPATAGQSDPLPDHLDPRMRAALRARGIERLHRHQREALDRIRAGRDVCVVTPTASGKTLCYNLPVLGEILARPEARAIYLFPTKALGQDQVAELGELIGGIGDGPDGSDGEHFIRTHTYDGDTPPDARRRLRDEGHVVVTNPHMLHAGILPNHPKWVSLFQNLAFVVIDELHHYRGVFGSHVGNVIRRLTRIAAHYGSRPRVICCSATVGNPAELARRIVGRDLDVIDRSGAPRGERSYVLWNPPLVDRTIGLRRRAVDEVRRLAALSIPHGVATIVFARSRQRVELILKYLRDDVARERVPVSVVGYRGGYLPRLRRRIERGLRAGEITGVVATSALELGVDIGSLDVSILAGWPGSLASFFQQTGRAGRRGGPSLAILVARSLPIDQWVLEHPDYLFGRSQEAVVVDPDNPIVRSSHLECAAFELPVGASEAFGPAEDTPELLDWLDRDAAVLRRAGDRYYFMASSYPADGVSLTAADVDNFVVYDVTGRRVIAEVDRPSAMTQIHVGAIYGLQGDQWLIERLDWDDRRAWARRVNPDYFTEADTDTDVKVLSVDTERPRPSWEAAHGEVSVTKVATIYKKIKFETHENVGAGEIDLPAETFDTEAMWIRLGEHVAAELRVPKEGSAGGSVRSAGGGGILLGAAHLLGQVAPLFVRCDPGDLRALSEVRSPHFGEPVLYLYDDLPGGVGLAERAFGILPTLLIAAHAVVADCGCDEGCPACVGLSREVGPLGKAGVERLLALLVAEVETPADRATDLADAPAP